MHVEQRIDLKPMLNNTDIGLRHFQRVEEGVEGHASSERAADPEASPCRQRASEIDGRAVWRVRLTTMASKPGASANPQVPSRIVGHLVQGLSGDKGNADVSLGSGAARCSNAGQLAAGFGG